MLPVKGRSELPAIKLLTEAELRKIVHLDLAAVDCVERAFASLAQGGVVMPPILSMAIPDYNGEVDVKTAYVPGLDSFALKVSPGFFDNPKIGLPSTSGLMILFSARTGMLEALLLDNGYLTDVRTAAAGAVAARHLARENASTACIIGSGMQARPNGLSAAIISDTVSRLPSPSALVIGVTVPPGATAFTRTPCPASSAAADLVRPTTPCLAMV